MIGHAAVGPLDDNRAMPPLRGPEAEAALAADPGLVQVTSEERKALVTWTGNWFALIQNVLWATNESKSYGRVELDFVQPVIDAMDSALARLRGPSQDVMVYRVTPRDLPEDGIMRGYVSGVIDSTTAEAAAASRDHIWEITVPAGTPVLLVGCLLERESLTPGEVLLPRGRRFILRDVSARGPQGRLLRVEVERL